MALGHPLDVTTKYKQNIYSITLDVSGWDKVCVHAIAPLAAPISVYGSNDAGAITGVTQGNAELAINFSLVQATPLSTGTAATTIASAGLYTVPVNAQFLRLQGGGADVYKLLVFESKVS